MSRQWRIDILYHDNLIIRCVFSDLELEDIRSPLKIAAWQPNRGLGVARRHHIEQRGNIKCPFDRQTWCGHYQINRGLRLEAFSRWAYYLIKTPADIWNEGIDFWNCPNRRTVNPYSHSTQKRTVGCQKRKRLKTLDWSQIDWGYHHNLNESICYHLKVKNYFKKDKHLYFGRARKKLSGRKQKQPNQEYRRHDKEFRRIPDHEEFQVS